MIRVESKRAVQHRETISMGSRKNPITGEVEENKAKIQQHTSRINHKEKAGRSAHKRREHKD